jgi:N-acetylglucosaminyldiphosphoundecaprenol N-acetyl-beta-D-mannosaminyltransferase
MTPDRLDVLGVPVDAVTADAALARVRAMLTAPGVHTVMAVNPEKVIAAQHNRALLDALNDATLVIPDGIGVVFAARALRQANLERVPGSELMPAICRMAAAEGHRVFLYGARPQVVARAAVLLQECYPGLQIGGVQHGYVPDSDMDELIGRINDCGAQVLFVGLGSPRQELWMQRYRNRLTVKVCQGVGGTIDAICGHPRRAPAVFRRLNLEWLYRLVTQPRRAHRQAALPRFAAQVLRQTLIRK